MATKITTAAATRVATGEKPQRFYEVEIRLGRQGGEVFAKWAGLAADADTARSQALDDLWDDRLNSTTFPVYNTSRPDAGRYLVGDHWLQSFEAEPGICEVTRWVYDRGTKKLLAAQIVDAEEAWATLDEEDCRELHRAVTAQLQCMPDNSSNELADRIPVWATSLPTHPHGTPKQRADLPRGG